MELPSDGLVEATLLFFCPEILPKSILYCKSHSNDRATTEIPNIKCDKRMTVSQYRTFQISALSFRKINLTNGLRYLKCLIPINIVESLR